MKTVITKYLESKEQAWSPSTLHNERYRLLSLADSIDGNPKRLYEALSSKAPYTRATSFRQVAAFWGWGMSNGLLPSPNPYGQWLETNRLAFNNVYKKKRLTSSLGDILPLVNAHPLGQFILTNGLRLSEALNYRPGTRQVTGKGNKTRAIFGPEPTRPFTNKDVTSLRALLKKHGLTPHDLRRLFATELLRKGMDLPSLLETMGWNSLETAQCYLQPLKHDSIKELVNEAIQIPRSI